MMKVFISLVIVLKVSTGITEENVNDGADQSSRVAEYCEGWR